MDGIKEIIAAIDNENTILFCGAGISRNSGLPIVNQIVPYILEKTGMPKAEAKFLLDKDDNPRMPFESFIETLQQSTNIDSLLKIYTQGEPNTNHILLAKLIKLGKIKTIVTTNFDKLIEKALALEPNTMREGIDYDLIYQESKFENIKWQDGRIKIIKIHGSVDDIDSMAITLKQVSGNTLSFPRKAVIRSVFSNGSHDNVLILGYSSSDIFDISKHITGIEKEYKTVYYLQHSSANKVENINVQIEKNPFRKFNGRRIFYDTNELIRILWERFVPKGEVYKPISGVTLWKNLVDEWYAETITRNTIAFKNALPGTLFSIIGNFPMAKKYYSNALDTSTKANDQDRIGFFSGALGNVYTCLGEYFIAVDYLNIGLNSAKNLDTTIKAMWYAGLGIAYRNLGKYDNAKDCLEFGQILAKKTGHYKIEQMCSGNLGLVYENTGEYKKAIKNHKDIFSLANEYGDKDYEAAALNNLGSVYTKLGEFDKARESIVSAIQIAKDIGDYRGEGLAYNTLGNIHKTMGEFDTALENYEKALKIAILIKNQNNEGACYGNMGICYLKLGKINLAIKNCEGALYMTKKIGDKHGEAQSYGDLGIINTEIKKYEKAIELFNKSIAVANQIGDKDTEAIGLNGIGEIYFKQEDYRNARSYFRKSLNLLNNNNVAGSQVTHNFNKAHIRVLFELCPPLEWIMKLYNRAFKKYGGRKLFEFIDD